MAKKQTRRSISVSRTTYERLKAFCETNHISMSQLVETQVNGFLGPNDAHALPAASIAAPSGSAGFAAMPSASMAPRPIAPRPSGLSSGLSSGSLAHPSSGSLGSSGRPVEARPVAPVAAAPAAPPPSSQAAPSAPSASSAQAPMTSAAARFAVDPPPPIIKPRQDTAAPKPAEKRPEQIFTF